MPIFYDTKNSQNPATKIKAITTSNTVDLPFIASAIYVGGAGNISILAQDDETPVTFTAVPVGTILPIRAKRVFQTGTTATLLVALGN
ncbi:MAG: hypothetical protein LRY50_07500 [Geovibrio sp.]|nr:hypothetical protein [Geovibrio sp.]